MKSFNLLKESFLFAINALKVNGLRTILTLLGITIGIFAIISVFTIFDSLEKTIKNSLSALGDDIIYVQKWPWAPPPGEEYKWWEYLKRPVPKTSEYEAIKRFSKKTEAASFSISGGRTVKYKNNAVENTGIWANTHEFDQIRSFEIEFGRYFTPFESKNGSNLAIIGHQLALDLFKNIDPLDKEIKVGGLKLKVIGVLKKEGKNEILGGGSLDEFVLTPFNYAKKVIDVRSESTNPMIMIKAREGVPTRELMDEIKGIIRTQRRLKPLEKDNFALNQASLINNVLESIFGVFNMVGWLIGGFSIIVGGFGIANIMFVSVKERTHIIGIQKSLGAKRRFIMAQFLYEAIMLSLVGGAIGLLLIFIGSLIASTQTDFKISLSFYNIFLGLFISGIIGFVSGYAPARTASRMNPVDAINSTF